MPRLLSSRVKLTCKNGPIMTDNNRFNNFDKIDSDTILRNERK